MIERTPVLCPNYIKFDFARFWPPSNKPANRELDQMVVSRDLEGTYRRTERVKTNDDGVFEV